MRIVIFPSKGRNGRAALHSYRRRHGSETVLEALRRGGNGHCGAIVAKRELIEDVWGDRTQDSHVVETTVGRLRTRLAPDSDAIVSVPRRGYRLA